MPEKSSQQPIVTIDGFTMKFGRKIAVNDLSFTVNQGEVFGLLGSNGSGKTTTIRALMGIYQPTAGQLLIDNQKFSPNMSSFLGYLPEERGLYKKESVLDTMTYFGQLKGLPRAEAQRWSTQYLERVDLADKAHTSLDKLSGGQQQKVQLGTTIMNKPRLLILDEPTKGFDPVNRRLMMDIVQERISDGATVILVTHQMEEVEKLCQRIVLLKDGRRRAYGSVDQIRQEYGSQKININFSGRLKAAKKHFTIQQQSANHAELDPLEGVGPQEVLQQLVSQPDLRLQKFEVAQSSLDDIFVKIYQEAAHA